MLVGQDTSKRHLFSIHIRDKKKEEGKEKEKHA